MHPHPNPDNGIGGKIRLKGQGNELLFHFLVFLDDMRVLQLEGVRERLKRFVLDAGVDDGNVIAVRRVGRKARSLQNRRG